jgi:hypothetical protein
MKITKKQLIEMIEMEIKNISIIEESNMGEGCGCEHKEDNIKDYALESNMREGCGCEHKEDNIKDYTLDDFEQVGDIDNSEIESVDLEQVKNLAEEFKRMKELVDFRKPLLYDK